MIVYTRTDEGQDAAYSAQSALPRKLKSILRVIDGTVPVATYEQKLHSFGDVRRIFQSLHMAGLIRPVAEAPGGVRVNTALADAERTRLMQPRHAEDWSATNSPYGKPSQPAAYANSNTASKLFSRVMAPQVAAQNASALKAAVDDMANFVLMHLPNQSFQILKEIEDITSLELLAVTLGGYEQMVRHLGEPAVQHIRYIKQILRDHL